MQATKKQINHGNIGIWIMDNILYIVLAALVIIIAVKEPSFIGLTNFANILTQSSVRIIIALGIASLIVTQGTDLSAGRQVGLNAVVAASLLQAMTNVNKVFPHLQTMPIPVVILIVACIGAVFGMLNGIIIAYLRVTPFIATLGTMIIAYGINSLYYDKIGSAPVAGLDASYSHFVQGALVLGPVSIPYLILYAAAVIIIMWVLWNKTIFGKNIFAIGGNPEAAAISGVNVQKTLVMVYALAGALYGFGGMLEAGRIGSATNNLGFMYELDAIAACVVGGISFSGGVGKIAGAVIGVIVFTVINYGLTYIGVSPYWQLIVKGIIIIAAVSLDMIKYRRRR